MKNEMLKEMLDELVEAIFGMEKVTEVREESVYDILDDLYDCINLNDKE